MTTKGKRYPAEVRERAVRLVMEHRREYRERMGGDHFDRSEVRDDGGDAA